jgi:hypothetical protein
MRYLHRLSPIAYNTLFIDWLLVFSIQYSVFYRLTDYRLLITDYRLPFQVSPFRYIEIINGFLILSPKTHTT